MRLTTTGRRSGVERSVIVACLEDERALVTPAMNGWAPGTAAVGDRRGDPGVVGLTLTPVEALASPT